MGTRVGTGGGVYPLVRTAVTKAVQRASAGLGGAKPTCGFLFASPDHDLGAALEAAKELSGAEIVGCTTAGELNLSTEGQQFPFVLGCLFRWNRVQCDPSISDTCGQLILPRLHPGRVMLLCDFHA